MSVIKGLKIRCDLCRSRYPVPDPIASYEDTDGGLRTIRVSEAILERHGWLRIPCGRAVKMVCPSCAAFVLCSLVAINSIREGLSDA